MLEVPNSPRKCGSQRDRGCTYLDSAMSGSGSIQPGVWLLDWCRTDPPTAQFAIDVPPRAMIQIDPLATVLTRSIIPAGGMVGPLPLADDQNHLTILGRFGLLDHVGENNYTPWSFMQELRKLGPSRKVPHDVAAEIAKHLPCPIIFTMPLPILGNEIAVNDWRYASDPTRSPYAYTWTPTWENPHWTLLARQYDGGPEIPDAYYGDDHFEVAVLQHTDGLKPGERRAFGETWIEMPFAVAVVTRAVYICNDDEECVPEALRGSGVQPAKLTEVP
jgi:hypothetical protein